MARRASGPARRPAAATRPRRPRPRRSGAYACWRRSGRLPDAPLPRLPDLLQRHGPDEALWLQRCVAATVLASSLALAPLDDAQAASAQLGVSVTVPLVAAMQMHYQVPTLTVTATDVARGYVDVVAGSRFSVATTSRDGYVVDLVPRSALFSAVDVMLADVQARLGPDGGTLVARGRPRRDANAALSYRFRLAAGVGPGTYPFPLDLVVRPL